MDQPPVAQAGRDRPARAASYTHRARGIAALGGVLLAIVLAGCGGSGSSSQTSGSPTSGEPPLQATGSPTVVASGIPFPYGIAFDDSGHLWVTSAPIGAGPSQTGIWYVPPGGHPLHVVTGLASPDSLTWVGNRLYVGNLPSPGSGQVTVFEGFTGSGFTHQRVLNAGLPTGMHPIGSIVRGPEGRLFIGLGAVAESGPPGRVDSFSPSGGSLALEATGVRTAYGLAFWGPKLVVTNNGP